MKTLTNYTKLKRTILALQYSYGNQKIDKQTIINCLNNIEFQTKYVNF